MSRKLPYDKLCRVCLKYTTTKDFKIIQKDVNIQVMLEECLSIQANDSEPRPKIICEECLKLLKRFHKFRKFSLKNEYILKKHLHDFVHVNDVDLIRKTIDNCQNDDADVDKTDAPKAKANFNNFDFSTFFDNEKTGLPTNVRLCLVCHVPIDKSFFSRHFSEEHLHMTTGSNQTTKRHELNKRVICTICKRKIRGAAFKKHLFSKHFGVNKKKTMQNSLTKNVIEADPARSPLSPDRHSPFDEEFRIGATVAQTCFKIHYRCKYCRRDYENEMSRDNHVRICDMRAKKKTDKPKVAITPLRCTSCTFVTPSRDALEKHVQYFHNQMVLCQHCGLMFDRVKIKRHVRLHKPKKICPVCGLKFEYYKLNLHIANKHDPKREKPVDVYVKCESCLKDVKPTSMRPHLLSNHTKFFVIYCKFCNRKMRCQSQYDNHIRSHTDERPFECEYCPMTFRYKRTLDNHTPIHTGERRHVCGTCGKGFIQSTSYHTHVKKHHLT